MRLRIAPAIFVGIFLLYINLLFTNIVSLRQVQFIQSLDNQTEFKPLHDTLFIDWIKGYNIDKYVTLALRDMVDVCTYSWVRLVSFSWWTCSRKPIIPAKILMTHMVVIPVFSISQLLTIIPDATPNCIHVYEIPREEDYTWIFWKWPSRACGNMLWSSSLAQLIIFTAMAVQMIPRGHKGRYLVWVLGECWTFITMIFIFSARYQYSMDVFVTILVIKLLVSHPWIEMMASHLFIKKGRYYARAPTTEMPSL